MVCTGGTPVISSARWMFSETIGSDEQPSDIKTLYLHGIRPSISILQKRQLGSFSYHIMVNQSFLTLRNLAFIATITVLRDMSPAPIAGLRSIP